MGFTVVFVPLANLWNMTDSLAGSKQVQCCYCCAIHAKHQFYVLNQLVIVALLVVIHGLNGCRSTADVTQ